MKHLSRLALTLAALTALAAIWQPIGHWWQWIATSILLVLIGAALGGTADGPQDKVIPIRDGEIISGTGDSDLDHAINQRPAGRSTGPYVRFTNDTGRPEQIIHPNRPTYGKPKSGDDQ